MRIGLITPGFSASVDDWCVPALTDLARVLAETDELTVFALRYPHRRDAYRVHGTTVLPTGGAQRRGLARLPIFARTLTRVLREAKRKPFDVLWAWWAHEPGFLAALAGRRTRTPVLVSVLGGELVDLADVDYGGGRSRINRWLIARALRGASSITVGSEFLRELAEERLPSTKIALAPLGIERQRFSPKSREASVRLEGEIKLLQVASLIPVKDQRTLLAAFAIVARKHPGAWLHLVGEGELRSTLTLRAQELGLRDRVVFHGALEHERLADVYLQADLLIQTSRFEAQGMAVLESVACGCPAVGTGVGVLPELATNLETGGGVTAPQDVEALAEVILALLEDPVRRRGLAEAQITAAQRLELEVCAARWRQQLQIAMGSLEPDELT